MLFVTVVCLFVLFVLIVPMFLLPSWSGRSYKRDFQLNESFCLVK